LDGATDTEPSSLQLADMPVLRRLTAEGETVWIELLDAGVPIGSETAIASLLGWRPPAAVDRAVVDAAARGLETDRVRRIDLRGGHRLLAFADTTVESDSITKVWPAGTRPPRVLDETTTVIGAAGAATGLAALMGARAVVPAGATGRPGSDLRGKGRAALGAIADGAARVVVHVGGADEASHARDRPAKLRVLEQADRDVIAPLHAAIRDGGGTITVGPDHGCDPATGEHVGGPVPLVRWSAA
jgi:2,3-bisphosphoglycerate-independent phosphoglycerate mutase